MSTLSGIVSKGEKGKTKYQSIDINSLYRSSRGESLEQHQQKNAVPRKHGMQSLGKVPSARRPPANLPSLRSETSSSDPAVSLVPSGGSGWATTKDSAPTTNTVTTTTPSDNVTTNSQAQCTTGPTPVSLTPQQHPPLPGQQSSVQTPHPSEAGNKSSWSAIMSRSGDAGGGPPGQQQQTTQNREVNAQYGPGPSLRPQTEGSWIQGGSRIVGGPSVGTVAGAAGSGSIQAGQGPLVGHGVSAPGQPETLAGGRSSLGQSPGMATAPAGQQNNQIPAGHNQVGPNMHHYRGIIPPFMYRGNFPGGNFPAQFPAAGPRPRFNHPAERPPAQQQRGDRDRASPPVKEEIQTRPIIKEEDLSRMDDISRDAGWTASDDIDYNQKLAFSDDEAENEILQANTIPSTAIINKKDDNKKELEKLVQEEKHAQEEKEQTSSREKEREQKETNVSGGNGTRNEPRNDMQSLRSWNNQGPRSEFRGMPGPPPSNYPPPQQSMRPSNYALRAGGDEDELLNQRRRDQVSEKVASTIERARQRKEEEEKRFQELTKQAAAKKLQDLENKLKEKHKQKDEEELRQNSQVNDSNKTGTISTAAASIIPLPDWERDREGRSRTSSTEGIGKDTDNKQSSSGQQPTSSSMKSGHPLSAPPRRSRADSDVSGPLDDDSSGASRPGSRALPPPMRSEERDRHRHSSHRSGGGSGYEPSRKQDPGYYDDYPRRSGGGGDRYKDYEYDDRHGRDGGSWADQREHVERRSYDDKPESRDSRDNRDIRSERDIRDKKDYDNYSKGLAPQDSFDDQSPSNQPQHSRDGPCNRSESSVPEWRDERRDVRSHDDRSSNDGNRRSGDLTRSTGDEIQQQRSERPQRPDSRDSRASRESRTSLRADDDNFHKSSRESGSSSWAACNDFSDYEDGKKPQLQQQRDIFREDIRERDRDRDRDRDREGPPPPRDRRQPPGPVTKEKLDQEEVKRGLTQLKRGGPDVQDKKDSQSVNQSKSIEQSSNDSKKDSPNEAWNRNKPERTSESGNRSGTDSAPKSSAWADAVSPTFEKEEEEKRIMMESQHSNDDDKKISELKQSIEKLSIDSNKRDLESNNDNDKDDQKDDKRDKNTRNRASSSGSRGPRSGEPRGTRQWGSGSGSGAGSAGSGGDRSGGTFSVYGQRGWRGAEAPTRGRRSGGPRSMVGRSGSVKGQGNYERTDSELSGDELASCPPETTKDERRPSSARSPKPSAPKGEKDERNRSTVSSRKDEPQQGSRGDNRDYNQTSRNEKRADRSDYSEVRGGVGGGGSGGGGGGGGRPSREGFAPSGEPSRRGRGGFRNNRGAAPPSAGSATSGRMEGYGPPPSKSPFSSERVDENKHAGSQQHSSTPTPSEHEDGGSTANQPESTDDKIIAKQQALTAGITGRHAKSPNQLNANNHGTTNARELKKGDSRSKRTRSGSRRGRGGGGERNRGVNAANNKQNNEAGNEDWETTSENSEEHADERKDGHGGRSNKPFGSRSERQNANSMNNNAQHPREPRGNRDREPRGEKGPKPSNSQSNRASGSEKGRNPQNASERGANRDGSQRNHSGNVSSLQNSQAQNGRPRSQGSANSGPINNIKSMLNKDTTVNRVDDIKLNDSNLVNQALNDINISKSQSKDKRGANAIDDIDTNCIDDAGNVGDDKIDADGFQEVRSKKNVKESSRQQQQKEEQQSVKTGRRDREKDRGDRDRSKSKTNGPQSQQQQQQGQNIPPLLGQPISQTGPGAPLKQYERNTNRTKLAPRFQKQRLAKQQQQQQQAGTSGAESGDSGKTQNQQANSVKDAPGGVAPPPTVNAWDKPFTGGVSSRSPPSPAVAAVPTDIQLISGLTPTGQNSNTSEHEVSQGESQQQTGASTGSSQRNSPNCDKVAIGKLMQVKDSSGGQEKSTTDSSSPPVHTLIFENTNYSKNTKNSVGSAGDMAIKSKYSNHTKAQSREKRSNDLEDDGSQLQQHQQQTLSAAFSNKPNDLIKEKLPQQQQEPIQMPLSFNNKEDNADMKLDFTFESDLSQLTEDKTKSLGMPRSMHITGAQSTISPSTAELNLKIASVKKVWESAAPMPTVVEHEVDGSVVSTANSFPQAFESNDVDDGYSTHQQYQGNMKNEITTSTNVCKLVPPQVKPQQQSSGGGGTQPGSSVPGPSPIGPGQSPIGHPPASLQGPLSPPPFNSTGQPSHINYQYPGSQAAAQYGSMSAIPSPPAVLFNTGSGQLPAQAGGLYGAFQLDQSRSPFTQYPPYAASLQSSFNQQNMYLQQPPPPHAPNAPTQDIYPSNLSQYRLTAAAAPPFGQNQQLSNNPNTVLISSSSNSLMSASVKPSSQPIGAIGTKAQHFQAPSAPQPNQLAYIPYDPNQVLGVSGSYMGNSQLVQRPGPNVQPSANNYYSATSADVFSGSQTGFYQPGGAAQQTGAHYGLQGYSQHSQSLATGNATPVGLQNFSSQFLSGSGLQIAAAAAAQQYRNPTGGLPGPANAAASFLSKHQQQEQPRQLKSPSGNQQDVLSVFSSTSPKSRKQQSSSQQPQPSPTQHHKFQQYQGVSQSALVSSYNNYVVQQQQNVRGMGMPPRGSIQPSQQRYPPPIQRPVVPFPPGPNPNNSQQGQQQQQNCMPNQQQSMNRHRPNIHQQQQQRNMKMQQQYYSGQSNVKMDSNDKVDSHNDKISDNSAGNQSSGNKSNANPPEGDNKEEVNQQNE